MPPVTPANCFELEQQQQKWASKKTIDEPFTHTKNVSILYIHTES